MPIDPDRLQQVRNAIGRGQEVFESLQARKGEHYALQISMFVSCSKMFTRMFDPSRDEYEHFTLQLADTMGYPQSLPDKLHEFITDAMMIHRSQHVE